MFLFLCLSKYLILVIVYLQTYVETLEVRVKEHEDYNSELQEGEKWLLHMSSRLVSPDLMASNNLEIITQQLANHKVGLLLGKISLSNNLVFFFFGSLSPLQSSVICHSPVLFLFTANCVDKHQCH